MLRLAALPLLALLAAPLILQAQQPATETLDLPMYTRIRDEGLRHSHAMDFAAALDDGIGPRLTGSPNMAKANAWALEALKTIGLTDAHLEDWGEFGLGWQQINTWARIVSPDPEPLWCQPSPWSPPTKGPVTGEVVYLDPATADLTQLKGTLAGRIVLFGATRPTPDVTEPLSHRLTEAELKAVESSPLLAPGRPGPPAPSPAEQRHLAAQRSQALQMMAAEGVAAIITPSRDAPDGGGTGILFDDQAADLRAVAYRPENRALIPNVVMMIEHYNRLARMVEHGVPVTVELNLEARFTGEHEHGFNTLAEIPGTDPTLKREVVMVGAHLDSWASGTGALDDGAGAVIALEAMRILRTLGVQPRRTIRIALWSGEEQVLLGSFGYVGQHLATFAPSAAPAAPGTPPFLHPRGALTTKPDWQTFDAYYNLDDGTGRIRGLFTQENFAVAPIFRQWLAPLADLGATAVSPRSVIGTDHLSFDVAGLPSFHFLQDPLEYETRDHHSNLDTLDHLHPADLAQAATVVAIFLYNTAQREAMLPRKPFPHPELDDQRSTPLPNLYPNATPPSAIPQI